MHDVLRADPILRPHVDRVVAEHGPLSLAPAPDAFARLVTSIVNQQLSVASAQAIRDRLFDAVDVTPSALLDAEPETLRACGLSAQKTEYVRNVARAFREHGWTRGTFDAMSDAAVVDALTNVRGVGVWTAKMFLVFALARPDVFPVEDLGIRRGMTTLYGERSRAEMVDVADAWRPHRSLGSLYVWAAWGASTSGRPPDAGTRTWGRQSAMHAGSAERRSAKPDLRTSFRPRERLRPTVTATCRCLTRHRPRPHRLGPRRPRRRARPGRAARPVGGAARSGGSPVRG